MATVSFFVRFPSQSISKAEKSQIFEEKNRTLRFSFAALQWEHISGTHSFSAEGLEEKIKTLLSYLLERKEEYEVIEIRSQALFKKAHSATLSPAIRAINHARMIFKRCW